MSEDGKEAMTRERVSATWRPAEADPASSARWLLLLVALFSLAAILTQLGIHFTHYVDYIGPDPDDSMRLVEVRDWLSGQSWFDLHQYRLGPPGGTLMHWSRIIDLPIATLIAFFGLFLAPPMAEVVATLVWPLLLLPPLFAGMGLAGFRLGGRAATPMTLALTFMFLFTMMRFRPGALDHHNVQLVLAAFLTAMLLDPRARFRDFALAGAAGAVALAIGAETTPLIAVAAMSVAVLWGVHGQRYRRAALGFGLAFAGVATILFFATTPGSLWSTVTCDTLSPGYLSLAVVGGLGLALAALVLGDHSKAAPRWIGLVVIGAAVGATALLVAPQCLGNPLANLDPLLQKLWLANITEAQPIGKQFEVNPELVGAIYGPGLMALAVCGMRIYRRQLPLPHAVLFGLLAISWIVSAIQVRGMIFSNLLSAVPLSVLVAELRQLYIARRTEPRAALAFVLAALASVPSVWNFAGVLSFQAYNTVAGKTNAKADSDKDDDKKECIRSDTMQGVAKLPPGRILSTFDPGPLILRFTPHAVLTANYHRNQRGMLDALKMASSSPAEARGLILADKIGYVMLCSDDPQVDTMKTLYPNGFFARLAAGEIPEFLEPMSVASDEPRLKFFRVLR